MDKYNDLKNFIDNFIEKIQVILKSSDVSLSKNVYKKIDK